MKKTITLEIPIPEYEWVDTPTLYSTPLGEFESIDEVNDIKALIEYLQRLPDRQMIIEADHQHVRHPLCRELIRDRLRFINEQNIWHYGEQLSFFLMSFEERTGLNFDEYKFKYTTVSNGKKIQFKTFSRMFNTEDEALRHIAKIYTSQNDFEFSVKESD